MNRIQQFLLVALFIPSLLVGQGKDSGRIKRPIYFSINGGVVMPMPTTIVGQYESFFGTFALTGYNITFNGSTPINKTLDFCGALGFSSNKFDLTKYLGESGDVTTFSSGGNYNIINAMPGISLNIYGYDAILDFHFLIGVQYFSVPELIYTGEYQPTSTYRSTIGGTWTVSSGATFSIATDIGTSLKVRFSDKFFGTLNADLYYSKFSSGFHTGVVLANSNGNYISQTGDYLDLMLFNLTVGLGYRF